MRQITTDSTDTDSLLMQSPREKYPVFVYEGFKVERQDIYLVFHSFYRADPDLHFHHRNTFINIPQTVDPHTLDVFAFNLGMVELFS